jgi:dienelactone hydrolase
MHNLREFIQKVTRKRTAPDTRAMLDFAAGNDKADADGKIIAVGFCISGHLGSGTRTD